MGVPGDDVELVKYEGLPIGTAAPDFSLPAVDGKTYSLASFRDKPVLAVAFWCNHCPYVQAWEDRTIAVQRDYAGKGVQFVMINANDAESYPEDDFANMVERSKRKGYNFPYLRDESQKVAESYGAVCTPDFFVFDSARKLRYRGKLDDSKEPKAVKKQVMREVLDAVLAGKQPPTTFPMRTSASARSPSSSGTSTTSAPKIPSRWERARFDSMPGIRALGPGPRTLRAPARSRIRTIFFTRDSVRWNRFTSICAGIARASWTTSRAARAATFPFTEITG